MENAQKNDNEDHSKSTIDEKSCGEERAETSLDLEVVDSDSDQIDRTRSRRKRKRSKVDIQSRISRQRENPVSAKDGSIQDKETSVSESKSHSESGTCQPTAFKSPSQQPVRSTEAKSAETFVPVQMISEDVLPVNSKHSEEFVVFGTETTKCGTNPSVADKQTGGDNLESVSVTSLLDSMKEQKISVTNVTKQDTIVKLELVDLEASKVAENITIIENSKDGAEINKKEPLDKSDEAKTESDIKELPKEEQAEYHDLESKQPEQQNLLKPRGYASGIEDDTSSDDDQLAADSQVATRVPTELSTFLAMSKECHYHLFVQYLEINNFKKTLSILKREWRNRSKEPLLEATSKYEQAYLTLREIVRSKPTGKHGDLILLRYPLFVLCYLSFLRQSDKEEASFFLSQYGKELVKQQPAVKYLNSLLTQPFVNADVIFRDIAQSAGLQSHVKIAFHRLIRSKNFDFLEYLVGKIPGSVKPLRSQESKTAIVRTCPPSPYWESYNEINKNKVYYGVRPDIEFFLLAEGRSNSSLFDFLEDDEDSRLIHKSKKRKLQKQYSMLRKDRYNPNAPPLDRIPLPRITNTHRWQRINAFKQVLKRFKINSENLPGLCFFTVQNANKPEQQAVTADINNESTMLAVGFSTGAVCVWSINNEKLKVLRPVEHLNSLNKESDDIYHRITDDVKTEDHVTLHGHSGTVSSVHFCPYSRYLLSASFDGTIRLWSLLLWSPLVVFRSHIFPVLCVRFSPFGLYFASSGMDRTARLWSTEHAKCLRMFVGHTESVDCVQFHPNTNYIATGSSDGAIRLWDVFSGSCVRHVLIEKGANVFSILFSPDGRFLVYSAKGSISFYDLEGKRTPIDVKAAHSDDVYTMAFSQGGAALVSGGLDYHVKLWNMSKLKEFMPVLETADLGATAVPIAVDPKQLELADWLTKTTPVLKLHFTYNNVAFGVGFYSP